MTPSEADIAPAPAARNRLLCTTRCQVKRKRTGLPACLPARLQVVRLFNSVNGLLIPGGSQALKPGHAFFDTASLMFDLTLQANDGGDYFPVSVPIESSRQHVARVPHKMEQGARRAKGSC